MVTEILLVAVPLLAGRPSAESPFFSEFDWDRALDSTEVFGPNERAELVRIALDTLGAVVIDRTGDSLTTYRLPDSSEVVIAANGAIRQLRLSATTKEAIEAAVAPIAAGYGDIVSQLAWTVAAIYLPIPVALAVLTAVWWAQRRRTRQTVVM